MVHVIFLPCRELNPESLQPAPVSSGKTHFQLQEYPKTMNGPLWHRLRLAVFPGGCHLFYVLIFIALTVPRSTEAAPWFNPGDPRLRYAVQHLADRGHLERSVTTWPMMVGSIEGGLDQDRAVGDDSAVMAMSYLSFEKQAQAHTGSQAEVAFSVVNEQPFLQGFGAVPGDTQVEAAYQYLGDRFALGLSYARAISPEDTKENRFDGSYAALTVKNVALGAGYIDRWWGPGWQSSLILSTNARPIPAVWLSRVDEKPFDLPVLKYLGPWQFTAFAGQLEEERNHSEAKMVGMRLTLRPLQGLDIGFSRTFTYGGDGMPENSTALGRILTGRTNSKLDGKPVADQIAAIDVRYGFSLGAQTAGIYGQMMGEDEAGAFPAKKSWLFGVDFTSSFGKSDQQWFIEYSDTLADGMFSDGIANVSYEHSSWTTGNRYLGRNQASTFEGDSRNLSVGMFNFFPNGHNLGLSVALAELNVEDAPVRATITDPDITYFIPSEKVDILFANLTYGFLFGPGWLDLALQIQDDSFARASGGRQKQLSAGISYRYRF
jgi:hypothetical protein